MAPPPGMGGAGFTFLISPDRKHNLYRDIRGHTDSPQWVLYAKPGAAAVTVSWEPAAIPQDSNLYCSRWDGASEQVSETVNCREVHSISTKELVFFRFWITSMSPVKFPAGN